MNNDLISRSELKEALRSYDKFGYTANSELIRLDNSNKDKFVPYVKFDDVCNCIDNTPTVDTYTESTDCLDEDARQASIPYTYNVLKADSHEDLNSQNKFRWQKKGKFFPTYYCPNCGKEALGRVPSIDNFEYVKSPFCPFCGIRLRKPRITKQGGRE